MFVVVKDLMLMNFFCIIKELERIKVKIDWIYVFSIKIKILIKKNMLSFIMKEIIILYCRFFCNFKG